MTIATSVARGSLDSTLPPGSLDTVTVGGVTYQVISPLPILPYLVFVPIPGLWESSRWIVSTGFGIVAAWMTLPLARRYGPGGPATWWLAALGAFGTLLWTLSVSGNFYYLAHVEATAFALAALLEWRGRRRPWVIGLAIALASLARPTLLLAAIPFGVALDRVERPTAMDGRLVRAAARPGSRWDRPVRLRPIRLAPGNRLWDLRARP